MLNIKVRSLYIRFVSAFETITDASEGATAQNSANTVTLELEWMRAMDDYEILAQPPHLLGPDNETGSGKSNRFP
jgi:hypothetical protein